MSLQAAAAAPAIRDSASKGSRAAAGCNTLPAGAGMEAAKKVEASYGQPEEFQAGAVGACRTA